MGNKNRHIEQVARVDFYKVNPKGVVIFSEFVREFERQKYAGLDFLKELGEWDDRERHDIKNEETYTGEITHHSRRRLSKALDLLLEIADEKRVKNPATGKYFKFKLAFQTLTLSASQSDFTDKEIKEKLLQPYLRVMRKKGMKNYVWKAEQQENGNIHFHIVTDTFVPWYVIRDAWNNIQSKYHFISDFEKRHGHRDPNSTDVKKVTREKEAVGYLLKYMLKKSDKTDQLRLDKDYAKKSKGKVWDCSANLKLKNKEYDHLTDDLWALLDKLDRKNLVKAVREEYYMFFFFNAKERLKYIPQDYLKNYQTYIQQVKEYHS